MLVTVLFRTDRRRLLKNELNAAPALWRIYEKVGTQLLFIQLCGAPGRHGRAIAQLFRLAEPQNETAGSNVSILHAAFVICRCELVDRRGTTIALVGRSRRVDPEEARRGSNAEPILALTRRA
jgi:hypothetical protein